MMRGALPRRDRASAAGLRQSRPACTGPRLPRPQQLERQLQTGAREVAGLEPLRAAQIAQLRMYCELVAQWNRAYNLIGARTLPEIVPRHVLDALLLSALLPPAAQRVLDVGTGAGLPGLPLAVVHPQRRFTLLDRSRKKTRFVRQAVLELGLGNAQVATAEAARYAAEPFPCIVARAVAAPAELARQCTRLAAPGAVLLTFGGPGIEAAPPVGWTLDAVPLSHPTRQLPRRTIFVLRRNPAAP